MGFARLGSVRDDQTERRRWEKAAERRWQLWKEREDGSSEIHHLKYQNTTHNTKNTHCTLPNNQHNLQMYLVYQIKTPQYKYIARGGQLWKRRDCWSWGPSSSSSSSWGPRGKLHGASATRCKWQRATMFHWIILKLVNCQFESSLLKQQFFLLFCILLKNDRFFETPHYNLRLIFIKDRPTRGGRLRNKIFLGGNTDKWRT